MVKNWILLVYLLSFKSSLIQLCSIVSEEKSVNSIIVGREDLSTWYDSVTASDLGLLQLCHLQCKVNTSCYSIYL